MCPSCFHAHNAVVIRLRSFVRSLLREYRLGIIAGIYIQVDGWLPHMRLHPRMLAFEFDGLRGRKSQRIHRGAQNVAAGVFVKFAAILD